ncbi:radical SAM/SPASM domain-containing protein [Chloroflexota bacterium]
MVRNNIYSFGNIPLYRYLIGAYSKYITVGKCVDFPLILHIQTQSYCNGRCSICTYRIVGKQLDQGIMEWNLYEKIVNEAVSEPLLSTFVLELHNEPLLDKRIFDCVKYIKSMDSSKMCVFTTNGELLDNFSLTDIVQSNLDYLWVSLNAHSKETYDNMNNGLDYNRVTKNIYSLLSNNSIKQKMELSFVLTERNVHEVSEAIQYWKEQDVKTRIIGLHNRGGLLNNYENLRLKTSDRITPLLLRIWRSLMSGVRSITGCELPFCQMNILFNGDVIVCCHDGNRAIVVGNVKTSSLRDIWNSKKMNNIRRLIIKKRSVQITTCKECSYVR